MYVWLLRADIDLMAHNHAGKGILCPHQAFVFLSPFLGLTGERNSNAWNHSEQKNMGKRHPIIYFYCSEKVEKVNV